MLINPLRHATFLRYGALPLGLAVLVLVLRSFFFSPYRIRTSAMTPELRLGGWALIARQSTPALGDIVLFDSPWGGQALARIVALPGDSLELRGGRVYTEGKRLPFSYPAEADYALRIPREQGVYPLTLPNLVAYRLALREETDYPKSRTSTRLLSEQEQHFWLQYLQANPYHTFTQDYYWVLCDQPSAGVDSRHFGLLPKQAIRGVVLFSF